MDLKLFLRGENRKFTENFSLPEFECKCGQCPYTLVNLSHVSLLQQLRDLIGMPLHINSGYRCYSHNFKIGGEPYSWHSAGCATDIRIPGDNIFSHRPLIESMFQGVGIYKSKGFIHVDSRSGNKARWER